MKLSTVLLFGLVFVANSDAKLFDLFKNRNAGGDSRISGGKNAQEGQFPYMVSVQLKRSSVCGGSIVNQYWILTAAHCVYKELDQVLNFRIVAGVTNLKKVSNSNIYQVEKINSHKDFDDEHYLNDIALMKVMRPFVWNEYIKPVNFSTTYLEGGIKLLASGWGITMAGQTKAYTMLQYVTLESIYQSDCEDRLYDIDFVDENQMCTYNTDGLGVCQGDSGGPIVNFDTHAQVGIVSYGVSECIDTYPEVYTRTLPYISWISQNLF